MKDKELIKHIEDRWWGLIGAELLSLKLNRTGFEKPYGPSLELELFIPTSKYLKNPINVTLRFETVGQISQPHFGTQNLIDEVIFRDVSASQMEDISYEVEFRTSLSSLIRFSYSSMHSSEPISRWSPIVQA